MTSKIEARRFSGKPGTMAHYIMAVEATFAVDDILEFFNDGDGIPDNKKADWKKAQQKIFLTSCSPVMIVLQPSCSRSTPRRKAQVGRRTRH